MNIVVTGGTQNKQIMIKLMDILKEIIESKKLDATGMEMDLMILPKFKENGKYDTNSSQRILIIKDTTDDPKIIAKDALNKWKEINTYLKQFSDGDKWTLRGISMGYKEPEAEEIANELLKLYPSGEIKKWNEDNVYFIFPLLDLQKGQLNEKKLCPKGKAYYNRRIAAGEKPSAYLSGRAVKVCKGLMEEDDLDMHESLRDWFKKEDWVRIDTAGNITGPCGTMKKGNKTTRCLPRAKANSLSKAERAATSKKKAASDKQFVPNTKKAKVRLNK